jgi:hypothetical protein
LSSLGGLSRVVRRCWVRSGRRLMVIGKMVAQGVALLRRGAPRRALGGAGASPALRLLDQWL